MRIFVSMRTPTATRNFESTIRALAERGHVVHVAFERMKQARLETLDDGRPLERQTEQIDALTARYPSITAGESPIPGEDDLWYGLTMQVRNSLQYLRFLRPGLDDAPKLRERAAEWAPDDVVRLSRTRVLRSGRGLAAFTRTLRLAERVLPQDQRFEDYLREQRPDVLLVTPLVHIGPQGQVELLRAARRLGIPSGLLVHSWDNLTTKDLIHEVPDMVAVWNEDQVREAVELHGVPRERVAVTGAPTYDQWFDWRPSGSRAAFCARAGLDPERPYLLYLCSSSFIAPQEEEHVAEWIDRLRASEHPELRDVGVLIRPHPVVPAPWEEFDPSRWENVVVFPPAGADPVDRDTKTDYFDSMYHGAAVAAVNTSAIIEAAIVGRQVHTLLVPRYRDTQQGTHHFRYLMRANGGPLHIHARPADEEAAFVAALRGDARADAVLRDFVHRFVRPRGDDRRATDVLADAVERLAERRVPVEPPPSAIALAARKALAAVGLRVVLTRNRLGSRA